MIDRLIPEENEHMLRTLTRTPAGEDLPKKVTEPYWQLRRCLDRAGVYPDGVSLALLAFSLGYGKDKDPPPTIRELWDAKKIESGTKVEITSGKEKMQARLVRVKSDGDVLVQFDGDPAEISVPPHGVTVFV